MSANGLMSIAYQLYQRRSMAELCEWLRLNDPDGGHLRSVFQGNTEAHHIAWCAAQAADEGDGLAFIVAMRLLALRDEGRILTITNY
ncbi:MAG: hypothetical protein HKN01_01480 [Acidimicrobiia bacterium]|nr:hypothetical protein [Acidimicrobiia bacterium]